MSSRKNSLKITRRGLLAGSALAVTTLPARAATPYRDVPQNSMFYREIMWARQQGILKGWWDNTFRPLENITREAFAAILYRLAGGPDYEAPEESPFADVDDKREFYREICWNLEQGIFTGWQEDKTFRPDLPIARDAAVTVLYRISGRPAIGVCAPVPDVPTDYVFRKEIEWSRSRGYMTGWPDGRYLPTAPIHRDAAAALIYRYVNGGVFGKDVTVTGALGVAYWAVGGPHGKLGLPEGNANDLTSQVSGNRGAQQKFTGGYVAWSPGTGAHAVRGQIAMRYAQAGAAQGEFGFPTSPESRQGDSFRQSFEGGQIMHAIPWTPPRGMHGPVNKITPVKGGVAIRRGWNGTRVRIIQKKLGIARTGARQTYDYETQQAVKAVQRRHKLPVNGIVDAATWRHIAPEYPFDMDAWQTPIRVPEHASRQQRIDEMIRFVRSVYGSPYTWGGAGWRDSSVAGYDCSGLLLQAMYSAGLDPQPVNVVAHAEPSYRSSQMFYADKRLLSVPLAQKKRGDLIFYGNSRGTVTHVAIYLGDGKIAHAAERNVHERAYSSVVWGNRYVKPYVKRPFP
ncbi:S-layer homology domain-containing protein [Dermabacteraceae bacterium P13115]